MTVVAVDDLIQMLRETIEALERDEPQAVLIVRTVKGHGTLVARHIPLSHFWATSIAEGVFIGMSELYSDLRAELIPKETVQ